MSFLHRHPESPAEQQALANLDAATFDVAREELEKEGEREKAGLGFGPLMFTRWFRRVAFHRVPGDPVQEPVDDPDPADLRPLHEVLHEHDDSA
jgi:hypothetical protein